MLEFDAPNLWTNIQNRNGICLDGRKKAKISCLINTIEPLAPSSKLCLELLQQPVRQFEQYPDPIEKRKWNENKQTCHNM